MAFNGSGTFVRLYNWVSDAAAGIKILATRMDGEMDGFATGLTDCVTRDGQSLPSANLPMNGFRHTGCQDGVAATDYATVGQLYDQPFVNALGAGIFGDGVTNNATAIQAALTALGSTGGTLYFPATGSNYKFGTTLEVPGSVYIAGEGKYATILRYTGTGAAFESSSTTNNSWGMSDLTLDLTTNNTFCIDATRLISGSIKSVRLRSFTGTGQTGIKVNTTDTGWTSYYNVVEDVTFDGAFADGVNFAASVNQSANRWRFIAPTFLGCADCFDISRASGVQIIAPVASENTSAMFRLGANADRVQISAADMESSSGSPVMWAVNAACNRLEVYGYKIHAGTDGSSSGMGIRAMWLANWDTGIKFSGNSVATAISSISVADDIGMIVSGTQTLGTVAIVDATAANNTVYQSSADGKLYFKDNAGATHALY